MGEIVLMDASGQVLRRVPEGKFCEEAKAQLARWEGRLCLLPCTHEEGARGHLLHYDLAGMEPVAERVAEMTPPLFALFVRQAVQGLLRIIMTKGLSLSSVLLESERIYCDSASRPGFLYTFEEGGGDQAAAQKRFLSVLRQLARPELRNAETAALWAAIDDPFADLTTVAACFGPAEQEAMPSAEAKPQMPETAQRGDSGAKTAQEIFAVTGGDTRPAVPVQMSDFHARPIFKAGMEPGMTGAVAFSMKLEEAKPAATSAQMSRPEMKQTDADGAAAGQTSLRFSANGTNAPTAESAPAQPMRPVSYGMDAPTAESAPAQPMRPVSYGMDAPTAESAPAQPMRPVSYGMDAPTAESAPAQPMRPVSYGMDAPTAESAPVQPMRPVSYGMDAPTDEGTVQAKAAPAPRKAKAPAEKRKPDMKPAEKHKPDPKPAEKHKEAALPPKRMEGSGMAVTSKVTEPRSLHGKKPEGVSDAEWACYLRDLAAFQREMLWWCVGAAAAVVLGLVITAMGGALGLMLFVLAGALVIAVLINRGVIQLRKKPKKPVVARKELEKPDIEGVFSVRIKLKSENLTSQVEITIRQRDQLIGSDKVLCLTPLPYPGISHRHCRIICTKTAGHTDFHIRDEKSRNGTELNGERLKPETDYPLHVGDKITLAHRYVFRVCSDAY